MEDIEGIIINGLSAYNKDRGEYPKSIYEIEPYISLEDSLVLHNLSREELFKVILSCFIGATK